MSAPGAADRPAFVRDPAARRPRAPAPPPSVEAEEDPAAGHVPGEAGLWLLILGDMTAFAVVFGAFLVGRADDPAAFAAGAGQLTVALGAAMTLVLLTSSLLVALAVQRERRGERAGARRLLAGAGGCAGLFVALKAIDWGDHLAAGDTPGSSPFWTFSYALTGLHLLHVLAGGVVLALMRRRPGSRGLLEGGASYWHMVDLLWVLIFPLLYLGPT